MMYIHIAMEFMNISYSIIVRYGLFKQNEINKLPFNFGGTIQFKHLARWIITFGDSAKNVLLIIQGFCSR